MRLKRGGLYLFLSAAIFAGALWGQGGTGRATLVGTIKDPTGSVIPLAKIKVVNAATSFVAETTASEQGSYYLPNLDPGTYRLTVTAAGFKIYAQEGLFLRSSETPRVDIQMELGATTETIEVKGVAPLLATENAASGGVLEGDTMTQLPIYHKRAVLALYFYPETQSISGFHVLGQRQRSIAYTLDGVNAKVPGSQIDDTTGALMTSEDAYAEVKVQTTGQPAQTGHSSGGGMSIVFKSGTNKLHGSGEDRFVEGPMIHRNYLEQNRRLPNIPFTYHESSGMGSGPVVLPKLYDGRNKTFWLFAMEMHNEHWDGESLVSVPTAAMLGGDFSLPGAPGGPYPIYNPFTTRQLANGTWTRDPFTGNQISPTMFDPAVKNFLSHNVWMPPNNTNIMTRSGPSQNLVFDPTDEKIVHRLRWDLKIDHQFTASHRVFLRWSQARHRAAGNPAGYGNGLAWTTIDNNPLVSPGGFGNWVFSDMLMIGPTLNNEFRIGANRSKSTTFCPTCDQDWAKQLGIPNVSGATFPYFNIGYGISSRAASYNVAEDITVQDNRTKVLGRHTLKAGYELIRTRFNVTSAALPSGTYTFGGTELPFTPNTGNTFASFLLGTVSSAVYTKNFASWLPRWWSHQWYVQDDWRPIQNLTLNLGVRWSYESPFQTKYGQQSQFVPTAIDPLTGKLGAIVHQPGPIGNKDLNNFAPRVGLAWTFRPHMVFRASFDVVHSDIYSNGTMAFNEYQATANVQAPSGDPRHVFVLSQGPPAFQYVVQPDGSSPYIGTNYSSRSASFIDGNLRLPYVMSWSGGIQYELRNNYLIDLKYQGQSGVGLYNSWNINAIPLNISSDPAVLNTIYANQQSYLPYPQFGSITYYSNFGHNTYHGGTVRLEKRYSRGFTLNVFYTLSKTLTDNEGDGGSSGVTYYNRSLEKARASFDVTHRFIGMLTYELPFGKGRRLLNRGGFTNAALGGWNLSWVQTCQSGPPYTVGFSGSPNKYLPGSSRPNILTASMYDAYTPNWSGVGQNRFPSSAQIPYLQNSAFGYPAAFTVGTLGRNTFEAPGMDVTVFSVAKWWQIGDRFKFQIRLDGQNLPFKQPQFSTPSSTYNASSASTFGTFSGVGLGNYNRLGWGEASWLLVGRVEF